MRIAVLVVFAVALVGEAAHADWYARIDTLQTYWPNGQLKEYWTEIPDEHNEPRAPWLKAGQYRSWHENGQLAVEMHYHRGFPDGWCRSWYPSGQLKEEGRYTHIKQGVWIRWSENGYRVQETRYSGDTKVGSEISFKGYSSAQVNGSRYYVDGELHGMSNWQGRTEFYFHGEVVAVLWADNKRLLPYADSGEHFNEALGLWIEWDEGWGNVRIGKKVEGKKVGVWTRWPLTGGTIEERFSDD